MTRLIQRDALTKLPHRMLLADRLIQSMQLARRHGGSLAVLLLDLDYLRNVNDSPGQSTRDALLRAVAFRLLDCVRASDTVSRQGGDEFLVLLSEIERPGDAALIAEKFRAALAAPYDIAGQERHVSVNVGISIFPDDDGDAETLIRNAATAMRHAKENGRDDYQFFSTYLDRRAALQQSVEQSLRCALERQEFMLEYQPKVNLQSGRISGAEALIRWQHPASGLLQPAQFIRMAEACGLMVPIGAWVLREACQQARAWIDAGQPFDQMAVNISPVEFASTGFVARVRQVLTETGLDPHHLEFELNETALMRNLDATSRVLQELSAMGIRLAVDDFGTGRSSLSYLKQFPIDTLKIDQSFLRDVANDECDATVISAMLGMGQSLHARVVAEGVETFAQLAVLRTQCCPEAQGYYFSRPVGPGAFAALFADRMPQAAVAGV